MSDGEARGGGLSIALVGTAYPMRGGIAQFNALLAAELAKRNRVEIVSFTRQYPSLFFPGKTQLDSSEDPCRFDATPMVDSIGPLSWFRAAGRIAAGDPDGLIFKYWMPFFAPAFGTIARRVKKKVAGGRPRVVAILDNLIPHEGRPGDRWLTRYFTRAVDSYIVMSATVRDDLLRVVPGARYLEIPHPVYNLFGERIPKEQARARLGLDPQAPLLLFFGFVRAYKGLDLLIEALPRVRERIPARLLVLGEFYEGRESTVARVGALGLSNAVTLRDGYVPNEEVGLCFSAADVVVLPYRSATQSGIVPIAYQLERPVICTDVGGLAEVVRDGETGLIVPPESPDRLADAVIRYFTESLEDRFVTAIRSVKRDYSWERMATGIESLLRGDG